VKSTLELVFSGDLILDEPGPDHWLGGIAAVLGRADLSIGHLEVAHTLRGTEQVGDVPAPRADPAHLAALHRAGFDALTLAGNHIADQGAEGILDTLTELDRLGIGHCGAGMDLHSARQACQLETSGRRFSLLSYNCVGPESSWAQSARAGCAYVRVATADGSPIAPAAPLSQADPESLRDMADAVREAKREGGMVIVALHKGVVHTPALLAPYERPIAHVAIDAGADIVISHHAHIVRGIELHRGKPIFHGLGNGCVVTQALNVDQRHPARAAWAAERKRRFGFEPNPAYTLAPFHPEAVHGMLGRVRVHADGTLETGFYPLWFEAPGRPVLASAVQAAAVRDYITRITAAANLPALNFSLRDGVVDIT
jgi:poly-gamma-glutamate capsule biosynthesis protein CapA/YwtB (metallophosphatase superfamily)